MSNENDKPIFGNEMKSTATEQTGEQPVRLFTPKEVADRLDDQLSVNDRLDVLEVRRRLMADPPPFDARLYSGPRRESNDQTQREIYAKYDRDCHAILDELGIPKTREACTPLDLDRLDNPNKKMRNAWLSGVSLGMLDQLSVIQRGELAMAFYGQYMIFMTQPDRTNEVMYRGWEGDVTAACDNLRVPRYLNECQPEQRVFLVTKMSEREAEDKQMVRRGEQARQELGGEGTMERFRKLMSEHPLKLTLPSHLTAVTRPGPPDIVDQMFDLPKHADHPLSWTQIFLPEEPREPDAYPRHEIGLDARIAPPRDQHKTWFTDYHFESWVSPKKWFPRINYSDSIDLFDRKMNERPRCGRSPGYWAVHQAWIARADILGEVRVFARDPYEFQEVTYYAHNGRQLGKTRLWQTLFYARHTDWAKRDWPRTPQMGFFLHATYPLYERNFYQPWNDLHELIMADLFPNHREIDHGRTSRTPRYPRSGQRHGR